jgi:hypothetical protein
VVKEGGEGSDEGRKEGRWWTKEGKNATKGQREEGR